MTIIVAYLLSKDKSCLIRVIYFPHTFSTVSLRKFETESKMVYWLYYKRCLNKPDTVFGPRTAIKPIWKFSKNLIVVLRHTKLFQVCIQARNFRVVRKSNECSVIVINSMSEEVLTKSFVHIQPQKKELKVVRECESCSVPHKPFSVCI